MREAMMVPHAEHISHGSYEVSTLDLGELCEEETDCLLEDVDGSIVNC